LSRLPCEEEVLSHIKPETGEYTRIWKVAKELLSVVDESGIAKGMVVGSIARDTWVSGDRDLDVFMLFDPSLPREELEEQGLSLARGITTRFGGVPQEKYAEHPYINTNIVGLDVDLVPCYAVESASAIISAVDRTPFHTRYITEKINGLVDDVLLFKQFSKAGGVYGSDQMTEGFAGYLCELLVLHYGGFRPLVEAAVRWHAGLVIDIENHQAKEFSDPLVVIDPVDPRRNVAASLSVTRMFEFVEFCRGYLSAPSELFFQPHEPRVLGFPAFQEALSERGTALYAITCKTPGEIPDIVVPQLRRSVAGITALLERNGFVINRADSSMGEEKCMLLFELLVDHLPALKRHSGPPVWNPVNAEKYLKKYIQNESVFSGPYIEDGNYYVEIRRRWQDAGALLASRDLTNASLGKHIERSMKVHGWDVLKNEDCWQEAFVPFISTFLEHRSPLMRIQKARESAEPQNP